MATRGRAPVKVGSGYLEIYPELSKSGLAKMRGDLTRQMTRMGEQAARSFSASINKGFSTLASSASKAAKAAKAGTEKEALDTSNKLRQIERSLTRFHGEEAGKQFRTYRNLARQREQLEEGTSAATRKAISDTVRANREATQETLREARQQAQEKARLQREDLAETRRRIQAEKTEERALAAEVRQVKAQQAAAARQAAAEQRAAEREMAAAVRQRLAEERAAHLARQGFLREELRGLQQQRSEMAATIAANRRQIATWDRDHRTATRSASSQWKSLGQATETYGQNLEQVGRSINQNLVMPLAAAAGIMTKIGATSADMQFYSSEGLNRAGFNQKEVAKGIQSIQDFAVKTPFSLEDMTDKFSQVARNFESYGDSTSKSLKKSELLIKGIADYAASFGVTNPEKVKGGMMAADMMMDQGKLSTRYLRQFVRGTGIPMNEIGKIAGYKGGPDFLKEVQDPKGGVNSRDFFDKFIKAYQKAPGVKGSAEALGTGSIGGHFTAVKEQAQLNLGKLFGQFNEDTGKFEWTELGQNTHKLADRLGKLVEDPDFKQLSGGLTGNLVRAINLLITGFEKVQGFLNDHPAIKGLVAQVVKLAVVLGPLAVAAGLLTKTFGKIAKSLSPLVKAGSGVLKGARGAYRTGNQALAGVRAGRGNFREAYRQRRADYHDGDDRSAARRGLDRVRGQDSRSTQLTVQTSEAEAALRQVDQKIQEIQNRIHNLNQERLAQLASELGGEGGVRGRASSADREIDQARLSVGELNQAQIAGLGQRLVALKETAATAESGIKQVHQAVNALNDAKAGMVRQQVQYLTDKADTAQRRVAQVSSEVGSLNDRSLGSVREKFSGSLTPAIKGSYSQATDLNNRIKDVNGRGLGSITGKVRTLGDALQKAASKAGGLEGKLIAVNELTGFGGGNDGKGKSKGKKHALGGVIPGYAPGVDNYHAILSPGEAVLRPEVASALGSDRINEWNSAAARGRISRHAKGKAGKGSSKSGTWPLSVLEEMYDIVNVGPGIGAFTSGIGMASAGAGIGGVTGSNVRRWGAQAGGDGAGRLVNNRFENLKEFVLQRVPDFLTKAPTGIGNLIGIAAGGIAPTAGNLFWDDIWKGDGNIAQRGLQFGTDLAKSIPQILKDLVTNLWDSGAEIISALADAITDPVGFLEGAFRSVKDMFTGMVEQVREMVGLLQQIWSNPSEYAAEVFESFVERAKELMPNTQGLFQFADGGIVPGYSPGNDRVHALLSPGEAILRPEAARLLGHSTVRQLNSGAKAGSLFAPSKLGYDIPLPDAEEYEAAVAKIRAALDSLSEAVQAHRGSATADWDQLAAKVRSAVDSDIRPAQQRWIQHTQGPLTQTERSFGNTNRAVWDDVQSQVGSSVSLASGSLARLRSNLDSTRQFFESASGRIQEVWRSAMSYVDSSTRSTVSGPYNRGAVSMLSSMAKLAGTQAPLDPVHFATGGVVPGYQPGVDTVPAMLSKGEGILRPEVVRALGAETILRWNDQARKGSNVYANGGIVGQKSWSGPTGGDWVSKHKDDGYEGYTAALAAGWNSVVKPMLDAVSGSYGIAGDLDRRGFEKSLPWAEKWTKWVDDHTSGGGQVVKVALEEFRTEAPMVGGSKYSLGTGEAWCADFISYVVDKAGANAAYGNSPKGAPQNRWPAVATWNAAMRHVPVSQSQPGDLLTYRGNGHINLKTGPDETVGGNESNSLKRARGYWRNATAALRPTGGADTSDGPVLNAWPGIIPKFSGTLGGGVDGDIAQAIAKAMGLTGVSGSRWADGIATIIRRESGGNPRAINNWDSNAKAGDASRGLMQVIPSTFKAFHQAGTSWDIFDPVANIAAAINYIKSRYKDISNVQQADPSKPAKGYWTGTNYASPGLALVGEKGPELINFRGGERVYNNGETRDLLGPRYEIHIHEARSEDTTQAVIRGLKYVETMYGM